jgi:hypothetical protein
VGTVIPHSSGRLRSENMSITIALAPVGNVRNLTRVRKYSRNCQQSARMPNRPRNYAMEWHNFKVMIERAIKPVIRDLLTRFPAVGFRVSRPRIPFAFRKRYRSVLASPQSRSTCSAPGKDSRVSSAKFEACRLC